MPGTPGTKRGISEYLAHASDDSLIWQGSRIANAPHTGLWADAPAPNDNNPGRTILFFDDFLQQSSATASAYHAYTDVNDGATGTNAFANSAGGVFNLVTAAAQDDYHGIRTLSKPWLFASGKELWFEAALTVTEAATNKAAWIVGLMDATTTGGLQTGSSGPLANFGGAVFWKNEGSLAVNFMTSNTTTQNSATAIATAVSGQKVRVGFYFDGTATTSVCYPFVDIGDGNGWVAGTAKNITLASLPQMYLVATVKAGAGGAAETMGLDYLKVLQVR